MKLVNIPKFKIGAFNVTQFQRSYLLIYAGHRLSIILPTHSKYSNIYAGILRRLNWAVNEVIPAEDIVIDVNNNVSDVTGCLSCTFTAQPAINVC